MLALEVVAGRCSSSSPASRSVGTCRPGIVPAVGLLLLGTVAFAGIGMLMAGTLRAEANLAAANGLFLVLLFLGGMAYPLDKLPGALEAFAKAAPGGRALGDRARRCCRPQPFPAGELVVLVVWAIARAARSRPAASAGRSERASAARRGEQRVQRLVERRACDVIAEHAVAHDAVGVDEERLRDRRCTP